MSKIADKVADLARKTVEDNGCELWDVEFVKEAGRRYLRLYIDKVGGVSIDDCESVSRAVEILLDDADPIPESYVFEVSSAGAERELKRPSDFERFIGSYIEIKLYAPRDGKKSYIGRLLSYESGRITIETTNGDRDFNKGEISQVRLRIV